MSQQELELPKGWVETRLGDIIKNEKFAVVDGQTNIGLAL